MVRKRSLIAEDTMEATEGDATSKDSVVLDRMVGKITIRKDVKREVEMVITVVIVLESTCCAKDRKRVAAAPGRSSKARGRRPKLNAVSRTFADLLLSPILTLAACHYSKPVRSQHIETCT